MARWLISDGVSAREVVKASVSSAGINNDILRAVVSKDGMWREFWPAIPSSGDPRITWGTNALTVRQEATDPADSFATITFNRDSGTYTYDNIPDVDGNGIYLNPPVTALGQYLIRVDQTSGDAITGTLGTWIDLFAAASNSWSLDQTIEGLASALTSISISADDGGGAPVASSTVVKNVSFVSEVVAPGDIAWTDVQRDLTEITSTVDADCILTFNPSGFATGDANTGSFNENWHVLSPSVPDPINFTVNVVLVSGTAPDGDALGVDLTLDLVRSWTLPATSGEDVNCELDVTVGDGVNTVTKVVTMHSQRTANASSNVWTTAQWFLVDEFAPYGATVTIDSDGTAIGEILTALVESEDWNGDAPTAPDPQNYEVMLHNLTGISNLITGSAIETWVNLASTAAWSVTITGQFQAWTWDISLRRVGGASVVKRVFVELGVESDQ